MKFNGQSSKKYLNAIRQLTAVKEARPRGGLIEHKTRRGVNINRKIQSATGILTKPAGILRHSPSVHRNRRLKLQKLKEKKKKRELDLEPRRSSPRGNRAGGHGARGRGRRSWPGRRSRRCGERCEISREIMRKKESTGPAGSEACTEPKGRARRRRRSEASSFS